MVNDRPLNLFISLRDSNNEVVVDSDLIKFINDYLCKSTRRTHIFAANAKIKRESKARIRTVNTYYPIIFSVSKSYVKQWARSLSLTSVPGLYSDLDLEKGKYEGGFKVWESTADLVRFITEDQTLMNQLLHRDKRLNVLELGAGAALPTLALLGRLIEDPQFQSEYRVHVQDYNWEVLASLTLLNFTTNLPTNYLQALIESKSLRLFYGDWSNFRTQSSQKYDLIMMSEVIYNSDNYEALHNVLSRHLKRNGYIVIATKDTYFGLSGDLYSWLDYLDTKGVFSPYRVIKVTTTNVPRSILILKRSTN